ncbi:hypothetical protein Cal6303_2565 [Calothrix sp. PCC 6303]|nr:hypothetical protein Cal6303_2565 [Calothrix sp. PCC 6303]
MPDSLQVIRFWEPNWLLPVKLLICLLPSLNKLRFGILIKWLLDRMTPRLLIDLLLYKLKKTVRSSSGKRFSYFLRVMAITYAV